MGALEMMSSPSSASTMCSWEHDVFICFRGEDTRMGFISHLYTALTNKGIRTFKDDKKLEIGNTVATELLRAIEKSRFSVVVLSRNFATSKWCLEELAKIVQYKKKRRLIVIPVFYHVSPSEVRHQTNSFEQAFANHDSDPEIIPKTVETWRDAFKEIGAVSGDHVTEHSDESEVVYKIMRRIFKGMQDALPIDVTNGLVGMESRVNEVKRILDMESNEVRFIGICGMSGVGKTTLAEVVYNDIKDHFQKRSFIESIKDVSKNNDSTTLRRLQQKVLDDILKDNIHVEIVGHGQILLGTMLRDLKVVIVLDDVNHVDQLNYLVGSREWFGPGSRIIVTTTNKDLLDPHIINEIYTCEELKGDEALRLFCQSAFKKGHPTPGYEMFSDDIVKLAGGLPLALNVYGSLLCGKNEEYWKAMLKKLREYPHDEVVGRFQVVYDRLDRDQRKTFIYIACFLKGRSIYLVNGILRSLNLYPECGILDLKNKFLITINHDDSVWVHDLLQQMCWDVLRKESEMHDGKYIAIKYRHDVEHILSCKVKGTRTIEIINQEPFKVEGADFFDDHNCFSKMMQLKFLRISKINFNQGLSHLSNDIRIVEWYGCSLKSLPSTFKPRHLFELEMYNSQLETLWEKDLDLPNLRFINLSFSKDLTKIPDLSSTPNLEKLNLEGCTKLKELDKSVLLHKRLRYMSLKGCTHLKWLGGSTMEMEALEALILSDCSNLENIPQFGKNMKCLEHLYVNGTSIKKLPDNLGNMYSLRNLDVSRSSIQALPSSIHHLKRLRLLCVHGCTLSFNSRGFLYKDLGTLSSGLRELDLSDCNLSVVPIGVGSLYHLINLDLSGNDFVSLPASISFLSKLRMLCLNNCKRLQSLPKLSLVYDDTDYEPRDRFNYYISRGRIYVHKNYAASNNTTPTVSCLNCPKLAENEHGSCLAENILNSYLQIRTNYWTTPEAVFEIVDAGRKFPSGFKLLRSEEKLNVEGPWIGVAICAVIAACHFDSYMGAKYMVIAHIHDGEAHWKIPLPINRFKEGTENQLIFYWTGSDDLQRLVDSRQRNLGFSFSVEPGDGNLWVTKFGVRIIHDEYIQRLKRLEDSTNEAVNNMFQDTLFLPIDLQWYIHACEADKDLPSFYSTINDLTIRMIRFFLDDGKHKHSLDGIHRIFKCLIEINHQVLSECIEEQMHRQFLPLVYDYYRISHGISQLYNDFVRLLKDASDSWLSVKLVLEQLVVKSRAEDDTCEDMLQLLNDLEAARSVRFSDNFIILFAYMCRQTVAFSRHLREEIQCNKNVKSLKVVAKVSSVTIAGVFSVVVTYMGDSKLLQQMKYITSYSSWLHVIQSFSRNNDSWLIVRDQQMRPICDGLELEISDFFGNVDFLQELKKKMLGSRHVTDGIEEDMTMVFNKLEKNIDRMSLTIEDMSSHAHKLSLDIREMGVILNPFVAHRNLQESKFGVCFVCDKDIWQSKLDEDLLKNAIRVLYRANLSQPANLPWYICACGADTCVHSCHSIVSYHTISMIKFFPDCVEQPDSLDGIRKIFECLLEINQAARKILGENLRYAEAADFGYLVVDHYGISLRTSKVYNDFIRWLLCLSRNWSSVKLALEEIMVTGKADNYTYEEVLQKLIDLQAKTSVEPPYLQLVKSFASFCEQAINFLRRFSEKIPSNERRKSVRVLAEASRVTIVGVFCLMATYVGDFEMLQLLKGITSNYKLLDLIQNLPRNGGRWFSESGELMKRSYGSELQIWDFHGDVVLHDLKKKKGSYGCFSGEMEKEIKIVIDKLQRNIHNFSQTIQDMFMHVCELRYKTIQYNLKT